MSEPVSALSGACSTGLTIEVADAGLVGQVTLKADLRDPRVAEELTENEDLGVPSPLTVLSNDRGTRIVWMAPDEVLVLLAGDGHDANALVAALQSGLDQVHHLAVNVSDARAVLRLTGNLVPEVLAKGAPIDLSPSGFPVGTARRTHLAGLAVAIWRLEESTWEIVCLRSFAHHLWAWLEASARSGSEVGWR